MRKEGPHRPTGNSAPKISAVPLVCPGENREGERSEKRGGYPPFCAYKPDRPTERPNERQTCPRCCYRRQNKREMNRPCHAICLLVLVIINKGLPETPALSRGGDCIIYTKLLLRKISLKHGCTCIQDSWDFLCLMKK